MNIHEAKAWIIAKKDVKALETLDPSTINTYVEEKADDNSNISWSLLSVAIMHDNIPAIEKLLSLGFKLDIKTNWFELAKGKEPIMAILKAQMDNDIANVTSQFEKNSLANKPKTTQQATPTTPAPRTYHLYKFKKSNEAVKSEIDLQKYVNHRFFRINKPMRPNTMSSILYNMVLTIDSAPDHLKTTNEFYVKNAIPLDGLSPRSIIIALSKILNEKNYIPTAVYKIGNTYLLCSSAHTRYQPGNVKLQVVNKSGANIFTPSVYGDGNGNLSTSINFRLESEIARNKGVNIHKKLRMHNNPISDTSDHFLNQLNFLRSVIEVVRYTHKNSNLLTYPIATAQARTAQLLEDGRIQTHHAYGLDNEEKCYKKTVILSTYNDTETEVQRHKAPFGVVTGTDLKNNANEVLNKINRINDKFNQYYADHPGNQPGCVLIEGCHILKTRLTEEYGSGYESGNDDSNYSDDKSEPMTKNIQKIPHK